MSFVTLSFLITTPECWVPSLGSPEHGFPLLSGAGRLVVKDAIMMGAALVTMADSAKAYLRNRGESRRFRASVAGDEAHVWRRTMAVDSHLRVGVAHSGSPSRAYDSLHPSRGRPDPPA